LKRRRSCWTQQQLFAGANELPLKFCWGKTLSLPVASQRAALPDLLTQITKLLRNLPTAVAVGVSLLDRCRDRSGFRNQANKKGVSFILGI